MTKKKSLGRYKGKFKRYGDLFQDPSHLDNKKVRILKTHRTGAGRLVEEGEEGIIGAGIGSGGMVGSDFDLKEVLPIYFPGEDRGYTLPIKYENLGLVKDVERKHKGHKKREHH